MTKRRRRTDPRLVWVIGALGGEGVRDQVLVLLHVAGEDVPELVDPGGERFRRRRRHDQNRRGADDAAGDTAIERASDGAKAGGSCRLENGGRTRSAACPCASRGRAVIAMDKRRPVADQKSRVEAAPGRSTRKQVRVRLRGGLRGGASVSYPTVSDARPRHEHAYRHKSANERLSASRQSTAAAPYPTPRLGRPSHDPPARPRPNRPTAPPTPSPCISCTRQSPHAEPSPPGESLGLGG